MQLCKMTELRKRKWNPRCLLKGGEFSIRWHHFISFIMDIVQLYKEDWAILHMLGCQAIALPSTEQENANVHMKAFRTQKVFGNLD